jgi:ZIP family zinc transporter
MYARRKRDIRVFSAFSCGIIAGLVCLSLLPECVERIGVPGSVALAAAGALSVFFVLRFIGGSLRGFGAGHASAPPLFLAVAVAAHNLPEGVALGAGLRLDPTLGLYWALLIALHNLPIGLSIGISGAERSSAARKTALAAAAGAPLLAGVLIASAAGGDQSPVLPLMALAAGMLLAIVIHEVKDDILPSGLTRAVVCAFAAGTALSLFASLVG